MLPTANTAKRIAAIDVLRGIIMVVMALDHTRDFFHKDALTADPLNAATTNIVLYGTRWITHFCAPGFVFLSGVSAWLQHQRKTTKQLSIFLITRGLWLIVFDLVVMSLIFTADIHYSLFILETLWSIGTGMVILGLMIYLPFNAILIIGLLIVFGHNLINIAEANRTAPVPLWWNMLHQPGFKPLGSGHNLFVFYPMLPWAGLMLLGYCCGKLFTHSTEAKRNRALLLTGFAAIMLLVVLRFINIYGDPLIWKKQPTAMQTFFAFMNVQKYPPSLLFMCGTIGPLLIALALIKNTAAGVAQKISVFGRVPLFYFAVHFFILHTAQIITYLLSGHTVAEGLKGSPASLFKFSAPGEGYSLAVVYVIWFAVVLLMYPICKAYDTYKTVHKQKWWLSYL